MLPRLLAVAAVGLLAMLPDARGAPRQQTDCGGVEYPAPTNARVVLPSAEIIAAQPEGFSLDTGNSSPVDGTGRFSVDGPGGHATFAADKDYLGTYTPPVPGHYTITASFRAYHCADGDKTTYWDVTTPAAAFDVSGPKKATAAFQTSRRPKAPNSPGDATLLGFMRCPAPSQAGSETTKLAVYYEHGAKKPTHDSPHLRLTVPGGCDGKHSVNPKRHQGKGFYLMVNRDQVQATATAPTRLRVLIELSVAGKVIGHARGRFRPVKTGESVVRG